MLHGFVNDAAKVYSDYGSRQVLVGRVVKKKRYCHLIVGAG